MNIHDRINAINFETATPTDLAILLEQIFNYHDSHSRDGGPILVAQGVISRYEEAVRRRTAPDLHLKTAEHCRELRSTLVQFETSLRSLEKDNAQSR